MKTILLTVLLGAACLLTGGTPGRADNEKTKKNPEQAVFLTPGGAYTKADITANGGKTVSEKYPGFMANHDAAPKKGDRICPVSRTKASPKLTWIVGGKKYAFCCPPCVTEFVTKAKKDPKSIKAPHTYVKK